MKTPVMFRVFRGPECIGGNLFALFPADCGTDEPHTCMSYSHVGQHSSADLVGCIYASRPAKPEEYADLLRELTQRGYDLQVVQRATRHHRKAREAELAQMRMPATV